MQTRIRKIGNSSGTIIPANYLEKLDLKEGVVNSAKNIDKREWTCMLASLY